MEVQMSVSVTSEHARGLVNEMYAAWCAHAPDRLDSILTEDAVHEDVASGHVAEGRAEIKGLIRGAVSFASDFRCTVTSLTVAGDSATTEWMIEGTQTGPASSPGGTIPPSRRSFRVRGASTILFRHGRIARITDYYDMATFLKQLGCTIQVPTRLAH
jgi:steroid delta-isomerase-like uncharacterized protein